MSDAARHSSPPPPPLSDAAGAEALKQAGNAAFAAGRHAEALNRYSSAIVLDPANHILYSNRSAAYLARGLPGDALLAISDANSAIRLQPGFAKAFHRKGAALLAIGEFEDAVAVIQAGIRLDPSSAALRDALQHATSALASQRMQESLRLREQQQQLRPASAAPVAATVVDALAEFEQELATLSSSAPSGARTAAPAGEQSIAAAAAAAVDLEELDTWDAPLRPAGAAGVAGEEGDDDDSDAEGAGLAATSDAPAAGGASGSAAAAAPVARVVVDPAAELSPDARAAQTAHLVAQDLGRGPAQLDRLLQRHHAWLNLNPYEVLQLPHTASVDDIKARFRRLSALVHPDKHAGDARAGDAFQVVSTAQAQLLDPARRTVAIATVAAARKEARRERKRLLRTGQATAASLPPLEEDLTRAVRRAFAELEQRRKNFETRVKAEAAREAQEEVDAHKKMLADHAAEQHWATGRDQRMESWQSFGGEKRRKLDGETRVTDTLRFGAAASAPAAAKPGAAAGAAAGKVDQYKKRWR